MGATESSINGNSVQIINGSVLSSTHAPPAGNAIINVFGGRATGGEEHTATNNTVTFDNLKIGSLDAEGEMVLAVGMILKDGSTSAGKLDLSLPNIGKGDAYTGNTLHINQITADLTDGDTRLMLVVRVNYTGGGLLVRYEHSTGLYGEASARTGSVSNEHGTDTYIGNAGDYTGHSTSAQYYGAHLGLGFNWAAFEAGSFDIYSKYYRTQQEGDKAVIVGDTFTFDDTTSHRIRAGLTYSHAVTEFVIPYVGAAWEYEFNGDSDSSVHNFAVNSPSLKGNTVIFDLGIKIKADPESPLSLDLSIEAYAGTREGVAGKAQFTIAF